MDRKIEILYGMIIILFIFACILGLYRFHNAEKGKVDISYLMVDNITNNSYGVSCDVKNLVNLPYLRMMTVYYDKYDNKIHENLNASKADFLQIKENKRFIEFPHDFSEKPALVDIYFFDQDRDSNPVSSIYHTSLQINN
ncbi:MAG: hypothetical protein LBD03_09075 [Methanobrevibacter sp.]|jgi:hypothetical protein|nr:hypothetical protein [Candidatus Methanovirga procula]